MDQQSTALLYGFWARTSGAAEQQNQMRILSNNKLLNTGKSSSSCTLGLWGDSAAESASNSPIYQLDWSVLFVSILCRWIERITDNFCLYPEALTSELWIKPMQSGGQNPVVLKFQ